MDLISKLTILIIVILKGYDESTLLIIWKSIFSIKGEWRDRNQTDRIRLKKKKTWQRKVLQPIQKNLLIKNRGKNDSSRNVDAILEQSRRDSQYQRHKPETASQSGKKFRLFLCKTRWKYYMNNFIKQA